VAAYKKLPTGNPDLDRVQANIAALAASIPDPTSPNVVTVTGDYKVRGDEDVIHVDAQRGPIKVTLPRPSSGNRPLTIKQINLSGPKSKTNAVTIATADGSKTIAGQSSIALDSSGTGSTQITADNAQHWPSAGGSSPAASSSSGSTTFIGGGTTYVAGPGILISGNVISAKPSSTPSVTGVSGVFPIQVTGTTIPSVSLLGGIISGDTGTTPQNLGSLVSGLLWSDVSSGVATIRKGIGQASGATTGGADYQGPGAYVTGLTGDVVATGPGSVGATIQPNVVSNSKFRQSAAETLVGNPTASLADVTDVSLGADGSLSFTGSTLTGGKVLVDSSDTTADFLKNKLTATVPISLSVVGGGGGSPPSTGLKIWLKADAGVTTSGSNVTAWADSSGNGNNYSLGAGTPVLLTGASGINSLPAIRFNNVTNRTNNCYLTRSINPSSWAGITVIYVTRIAPTGSASSPAPDIYDCTFGIGDRSQSVWWAFNTGTASLADGNGVGWAGPTSNVPFGLAYSPALSHSEVIFQAYQYDKTTWTMSGRAAGTKADTSFPTGAVPSYVGMNDFAGGQSTSDIAEILVYDHKLTSTDLAAVNAYLTAKWSGGGGGGAETLNITAAYDNASITLNGSNQLQVAALTGDVTKAAGGTVTTLATVNANVGTFTNATVTVNGKGLITAASSGTAPVTGVTATAPLFSSGGTTPNLTIQGAITSGSTSTSAQSLGALSSGILKQSVTAGAATLAIATVQASGGSGGGDVQGPGAYITALTGDLVATGPGSVASAFRNFTGLSVLARAAGTSGVPTELTATATNQVLQELGGVLTFHALDYSQLTGTPSSLPPSGAAGGDLTGTYPNPTIGGHKVTYAKMNQASASTLLGNPNPSLGDVQEITLGNGLGFNFPGPGVFQVQNTSPLFSLNAVSPLSFDGVNTLSFPGAIYSGGTPTQDLGSLATGALYSTVSAGVATISSINPYLVSVNSSDGTPDFLANKITATAPIVSTVVPGGVPTTGLKLWLDAAKGVTLSGSNVTAWTDQSGSGNNVATGPGSPTFSASVINGQPGITFPGSGSNVGLVNTTSNLLTSGSARSIIAVVLPTTTVSNQGGGVVVFRLNASAAQFAATLGVIGHPAIVQSDSIAVDVSTTTNALASTSPLVAEWHATANPSGTLTHNQNGSARSLVSSTMGNAETGTTGFGIGYYPGLTSRTFNGSICEVLVYDHVLSAGDLAALRGYLQAKYAITISGAGPTEDVVNISHATSGVTPGIYTTAGNGSLTIDADGHITAASPGLAYDTIAINGTNLTPVQEVLNFSSAFTGSTTLGVSTNIGLAAASGDVSGTYPALTVPMKGLVYVNSVDVAGGIPAPLASKLASQTGTVAFAAISGSSILSLDVTQETLHYHMDIASWPVNQGWISTSQPAKFYNGVHIEYPVKHAAKTVTLIANLIANGLTTSGVTAVITQNGSSVIGAVFNMSTTTTPGVYSSGPVTLPSSAATDTFGVEWTNSATGSVNCAFTVFIN
jgi:hypothetical protein